jgi:hypothetical protein
VLLLLLLLLFFSSFALQIKYIFLVVFYCFHFSFTLGVEGVGILLRTLGALEKISGLVTSGFFFSVLSLSSAYSGKATPIFWSLSFLFSCSTRVVFMIFVLFYIYFFFSPVVVVVVVVV